MKTIEIVVSPKGETTVTTKGFSGATCREASRLFEQALGQPLGEQLIPEFHQAQAAKVHLRQQG